MKRGEIWTVAGIGDYTGKPRPVVILQSDRFDATSSLTICPLTSDTADLHLFRIEIEPTLTNGLRRTSRIMADKISTVPRSKLGLKVGRLDPEGISRLDRAVILFLGLLEP
jgi:mRNA interferase MazF